MEFFQDFRVVHFVAEQTCNNVVTFFDTTLRQKPTGGIREEEQSGHDNDSEEGLESDWEAPLDRASKEVKAEIDPVSLETLVSGDRLRFGFDNLQP